MPLPRLFLVVLAAAAGAQNANYKLVFEDNFDGDKLNAEVWETEVRTKAKANYTEEAVTLKEGILTITTWTENKAHLSGSIKMKKAHYFGLRQGKVEGRLRFNPTRGISTLFGHSTDAEDDKLPQTHINIFASWGYEKGGSYVNAVSWKDPGKPDQRKEQNQEHKASVGKFWHTYGVEWDEAGYRFSMDGKLRMTVKDAKGVAAQRGIWLATSLPDTENSKSNFGSKETSKATYEIDWVKAWKYVPPTK
jgi:hypothetical protein